MAEVSKELATKVLAADLRNVIQKVSTGGTLSPTERELMERCLAMEAVPEELQKARAAALIRKYAMGGKLTKEDRRELGGFLPDDRPVIRRVSSEAYKHPYHHYAQQLGLKGKDEPRKLKRWVAEGRKKTPPDLPPFDQLDQLAAWWRRNKTWGVPAYIAAFESAAVHGESAGPPPPGDPKPDTHGEKPGEQQLPAMSVNLGADGSADMGLQQVRALVDATFKQLQLALLHNRPQQAAQLRREWKEYVNLQRQWEKDIVKIQEGRGEVLRTRQLAGETISIFGVFAQSFTNALLMLAEKLAPSKPAVERRAIVLPLRDSVFSHLKRTRFREQWDIVKQQHPDLAIEAEVLTHGSL